MSVRRARATIALLAALGCGSPALARGAAEALAPGRVPWREVSFQGSKFAISLRADLALEPISSALARQELLPSVRGPGIEPPEDGALVVSLGSEVLGRRSDIRLLIDPRTGAALQRVQTDSGRKQRIKSLRYGEAGISTVRTRPAEGQKGLPAERWTDVREGTEDYPAMPEGGLRVSDPTALFYVIASSGLRRPGDTVQVPIFSDDRILMVEAKALDLRRVEVDYERVDGEASRRIQGPATALRLSLDARAVGADGEAANFELAGLRGDVEMLLDPESRIPLALSGKVPYAGTVSIRVRRVVERPAPGADATARRAAPGPASGRR